MPKSLQFLSGGGEMGALMRAYSWEASLIGPVEKWPQSLRTTLSILLNSKFPMFLYWGPDLICFYNDAYRFSLGNDGKHPLLLGMKGEEAWKETWHILKPSIDQVLENGEGTWSEDQFVPIYREGEMKEAFWTFSFSPVRDEKHQTAGVFLTLIETTEKVNNLKKLEESNDQLSFAIEATELGTFDLNPLTNKFIANNRLKDWFGLPHEKEVDLQLATEVIDEKDRMRVIEAINKALEFESDGFYDIEYSIINPITKKQRIVRAKGRAWFGADQTAYRFNGTLQDITQQAISKRKIEESEDRFRNLIWQAPVLVTTYRGPNFIIETINKTAIEIWGKSYEELINKPLFEVSPELESSLKTTLDDIYVTGESFINKEIPMQLIRQGKTDLAYFNLLYQPLRDLDHKIYAIMLIGTEVTEAVKTRKLIELRELFNRSVLESSPDCLKVLDKDGNMQYMNSNGLCQMEIDDFTTIQNKSWWTLWGSENQEMVKSSIDKALTGQMSKFTASSLTPKGTLKWWDVVVSPVGKTGEDIHQIISVSRDITDKKKSEEVTEKLANYLKLATDSAKVGIWSLEVASSKLEWSDTHKIMWGYAEHFEDLNYEDWFKLILPEDKELAFLKIEEAKVNHSVYDVEYRINKADDHTIRTIRSVGKYYYNDQGEAQTLTGISIDNTEQKQAQEKITESEKQFRVFADNIQNLAWIANADGWIYFYNQQWYDYTGTSLKEMEGMGWQKVHHPEHITEVIEFLEGAWQKDETFELTCRLRRDDGEYRWFLTRGYPVKDAYGNIERWIGTNTDIHEQKTKEQQKDEFISIASHEMKTPLTTAKGYLKLLHRKLSEEDQTSFLYVNKANQAVERLSSLVEELLDASKIQNGKLDYNISLFDFNEMVDEAIDNIQLTTKNHHLQKTGTSTYQVKGDKDRLQQVMINLLSNAVKYSPKADKIIIKVEELDGNIQVSVQDFGVGMLSQHLNKVFDRYYRVQEHAVHFPGLGIGLYISSNIIQRHEGKMWVDSEPNKGSIFYFSIPI